MTTTTAESMDDGQRVVWPRTHHLTCPGLWYISLCFYLTIYNTKFLKWYLIAMGSEDKRWVVSGQTTGGEDKRCAKGTNNLDRQRGYKKKKKWPKRCQHLLGHTR